MKKFLFALATLTALFLVACDGSEGGYPDGYIPEYVSEYDYDEQAEGDGYYNQTQFVEFAGMIQEIRPRGSLTIDDFLADLDYMVYVLENNFALLDVAYWAHGVDYRQLAQQARRLVLDMDEPC